MKITRNEDKENINVDNYYYIFQSALNKKCEKYYQLKLCLETEAPAGAAVKQHLNIMLTASPCIETEKSYYIAKLKRRLCIGT